jgi:hypothetical protein
MTPASPIARLEQAAGFGQIVTTRNYGEPGQGSRAAATLGASIAGAAFLPVSHHTHE